MDLSINDFHSPIFVFSAWRDPTRDICDSQLYTIPKYFIEIFCFKHFYKTKLFIEIFFLHVIAKALILYHALKRINLFHFHRANEL